MKIKEITPVIICKDSRLHIEKTLKSLSDFETVILYDNGSTDDTLEIAKKFTNVKLYKGSFVGFGRTKNKAASLSPTDWILSIDSDEVLTDELIDELKKLNPNISNVVYKINRTNLFMGKPILHSGWNPDWIVRIYNRTHTKFSDVEVHESILIRPDTVVQKLHGRIIHYAVDDVTDFLIKTSKYSKIRRRKQKKTGYLYAFLRASFAFFRTYILKRGFLDGPEGLTIAVSNFNGVFFKYIRYCIKKGER